MSRDTCPEVARLVADASASRGYTDSARRICQATASVFHLGTTEELIVQQLVETLGSRAMAMGYLGRLSEGVQASLFRLQLGLALENKEPSSEKKS